MFDLVTGILAAGVYSVPVVDVAHVICLMKDEALSIVLPT